MTLQSVVGCLPAPLRLYFVKSIKWQVEAAFRGEVIAALCCSKAFEVARDQKRHGNCLSEMKTALVKEVTPRRRKVLAAGDEILLLPVPRWEGSGSLSQSAYRLTNAPFGRDQSLALLMISCFRLNSSPKSLCLRSNRDRKQGEEGRERRRQRERKGVREGGGGVGDESPC